LPDATGEALVRALVLGDRSGLRPEQWEVLTCTGTNHLIAISGLHVGMVAAFLFFLSRWVWSRSARLTLLIAAPRAGALAALGGAVVYSVLAGFAVSTQRALIMLAVLFSCTVRPASRIVLALVGVLILDPQAVLAYGFWLSFTAVAVLLIAFGQRLGTDKFRRNWGRAQCGRRPGAVATVAASVRSCSDASVEDGLVATQHGRLVSTILVAGHHGSATSTGSAFLATVAPHFVLYAAGYANRFGLPNPAVRKRVAAQGAAQLDTASAGAISFRLWSHRVESISSRKGARD